MRQCKNAMFGKYPSNSRPIFWKYAHFEKYSVIYFSVDGHLFQIWSLYICVSFRIFFVRGHSRTNYLVAVLACFSNQPKSVTIDRLEKYLSFSSLHAALSNTSARLTVLQNINMNIMYSLWEMRNVKNTQG